jgi:uncharacterized lipoprotein (TIGR02269 family)
MRSLHLGLALSLLLAACASVPSARQEEELPEQVVSSFEEGCAQQDSLLLLCGDETCGFFQCRDTLPGQVELTRGGTIAPPPAPGGAPRRWWGPPWLRRGAVPVLTFRLHASLDPKPPRPLLLLPSGRYVRHHIFPQASDLQLWFTRQGVAIHIFTLVIPEHVHRRIHSGGPSGGLWNAAWRKFRDDNLKATPEEIYRHAGKLVYEFELMGPIVPYSSGKR